MVVFRKESSPAHGLGETDQAFDWLSRAVQERSGWIAYLPRDPRLDALHGETRFDTLRATRVNRG